MKYIFSHVEITFLLYLYSARELYFLKNVNKRIILPRHGVTVFPLQ